MNVIVYKLFDIVKLYFLHLHYDRMGELLYFTRQKTTVFSHSQANLSWEHHLTGTLTVVYHKRSTESLVQSDNAQT